MAKMGSLSICLSIYISVRWQAHRGCFSRLWPKARGEKNSRKGPAGPPGPEGPAQGPQGRSTLGPQGLVARGAKTQV